MSIDQVWELAFRTLYLCTLRILSLKTEAVPKYVKCHQTHLQPFFITKLFSLLE
jgi:hypothetical protein